MKKTYLTIAIFFLSVVVFGQRIVEKTAQVKNQNNVVLDFDFADEITIKGWEKNEVLVKVSVNINDNEDNNAFKLDLKEMSSTLSFTSDIENMKEISKNKVVVKKSEDGKRTITYSDGWHIDMDIFFEVFLPKNIKINLSTISGDVILTNVNGLMDLETISGFIDLEIDKNAKASVETSTISGGVYTNHDIELKRSKKDSKYRLIAGRSPDFNLNGGGKKIKLETISGNIYIRK